MVRILVYGMTENIGGIEKFLVEMFQHFDINKVTMDFIVLGSKSPFENKINENGGKVFYITKKEKNFIRHFKELYNIMKKKSKDHSIIYFNSGAIFYIIPYLIAKLVGYKKIIVHAHNGADQQRNRCEIMIHKINRIIVRRLANKCISCSDVASNWIFGEKYTKNNDIMIIKNAIDSNKFSFDKNLRTQMRKLLNIQESTLVIGNIGRFEIQKNHNFMIDILNEIVKVNQDCCLMLIGEGSLYSCINKKIEEYNLADKVLYLGRRSDINALLNAIDIFILPSFFEGFPITLVEAQANGIPCIVSDKITRQVNITGLVSYLDIKDPYIWMKKILTNIPKRESKIDVILEHGFDINLESSRLQEIFISLENRMEQELR